MAIEGKALSRRCASGGRPSLNDTGRGEFAFGLRSIAVARRKKARFG
jgi:hypothetical protein